jgi:hypothetical protein
MESDAFAKTPINDCNSPPDRSSDDTILHHLMQLETIYHPVSTCKMMLMLLLTISYKYMALKVFGGWCTSYLNCFGNTNAPVYMIAEKEAADAWFWTMLKYVF